tara:strand:- start:8 stop:436 length:429 start_codon:yes stop_codon:yes gene_type:complete
MPKTLEYLKDFIEKNIIVIALTLAAIMITFVLSNDLSSPFILEGMKNNVNKIYNQNGDLIADLEDTDNHYDSDGFLVDIDGRLVDENGEYYDEYGELLDNENIPFDMDTEGLSNNDDNNHDMAYDNYGEDIMNDSEPSDDDE